ncbi:FAD-dependent monooxygenase [Mobilicoccus caccae]|uniref:Oxidoreductase n=1 Tax=Mobilicoccus caccae TaxID=1859295 RepID=A0ABQ6IVN0_9MICO|nr:FAD-dependent monooxygenase [Mobilicoccus caccae]GMA41116.1 oxidoreductase [Mobilicoccus caccae]
MGVPVVLLDARPQRDAVGSKALCQQRDVLDIWTAVGAGEQIAREGLTWTRARTLYRDSELFCQGFVDKGRSPFPPFVNISQTRTEQILDERIAEQPHIDVRWGHRVVGVEQDASGVRLRCAVDIQTDVAGSDRFVQVDGSFALVCSGARSDTLRAELGLSFEGKTFSDQFLICDIRTDMPGWGQERRFYFDPEWNPGRQVLIHPCPDSTFRIDWQVPPEYDIADEEASGALDARIRSVIGDRDYEIVWKSQYRFHARQVDRMQLGRVLVAGDAAHLVAPFGARGLNSGVPDAENAAWKLAFVWHGWAPESLLESYHVERHAAAVENLEVTSATMRFLVPQNEQEWVERREILEEARVHDAARARVDSGRLAEPFWYVDSPLTTPSGRRGFAGRPPKGEAPEPSPGVLVPDVPVSVEGLNVGRSRELARLGVTVLVGAQTHDPAELAERLGRAVAAPVGVHSLAAPGFADLAVALDAAPEEVWVLRPDAHIAAVLISPSPEDVETAVRRSLGDG